MNEQKPIRWSGIRPVEPDAAMAALMTYVAQKRDVQPSSYLLVDARWAVEYRRTASPL